MLNRYVSDDAEGSGRTWRKSSRSYGSGECIEVATPSSNRIAVRDSKNVQGAVLMFSSSQWRAFVSGVRKGKFSRPKRGQGPNAGTMSAGSLMSRPDVAWGTAGLQEVCLVATGIARLGSAYGSCLLPSFLSYLRCQVALGSRAQSLSLKGLERSVTWGFYHRTRPGWTARDSGQQGSPEGFPCDTVTSRSDNARTSPSTSRLAPER